MKRMLLAVVLPLCASVASAKDASTLQAETAVRRQLRDPDSAHFRNVAMENGKVCGEVNSRNGFGGYVGYTSFVYFPEKDAAVVTKGSGPLLGSFSADRRAFCGK